MFITNAKRFIPHPQTIWIIFQLQKRNNSSRTQRPLRKITSSCYHHASSLPLIYKTIGQHFDETVAKHPDHECYVFRSISIKDY
jgi:hypothetical protein